MNGNAENEPGPIGYLTTVGDNANSYYPRHRHSNELAEWRGKKSTLQKIKFSLRKVLRPKIKNSRSLSDGFASHLYKRKTIMKTISRILSFVAAL